jgi:hypothetical protein
LDQLFAGDLPFPVIHAAALAPSADRTTVEHDAVSRAAGCRDLFVIHADVPAGERAIADLARAVSERVLILTPNPTAADRLADRLLKCDVPVLRALADDENPVRPSAAVSKATSAALGSAATEQAKKDAAAALAAAEQRVAAFAVVSKAVARLREVNDLLKTHEADVAGQTARRERLEADLKAETDTPFATAIAKLKADHDAATTQLNAELQTLTAAQAEKDAALAQARHHHAEATHKPGLFARLFGGKPKAGPQEAGELEKQVHTLEAEVAALAARIAELQAKVQSAATAFTTERDALTAAEVASRWAVIDAAIAFAEADRDRAQAEAAALNKVISTAVPGEDHAAAERQLTAARQRAAEVAASAPELAARALAEPRVVVGTPGSLEVDPAFRALPDDAPFGLLILDRAEELPEAEFPRLSRLAERWVLVGDAVPHDEPRPQNGRPARNGRAIEVPFVARLAKALDREAWAVEGDRLVCRLIPLTPAQRREMTREPLADRPEIELRFTASDDEPLLAEITFPAGIGVHGAKSFLFHTLGEVLLRPCGEWGWKHEPQAITATWPTADTSAGVWIELEPGVREKVTGSGLFAFTAAVTFDPAAGWDAEKAEAWLANCLPPPATSRFAALPRSPGPRSNG